MTLCFAALIKVLKICSKPKVYNKTLCGAVAKTIDEYYGNILEADDGTVSHLLSCDYNLSPENIVEPAKTVTFSKVSKGMTKFVIPLLDADKLPLGVLALRSMALSSVNEPDAVIGQVKQRADTNLRLKIYFSIFSSSLTIAYSRRRTQAKYQNIVTQSPLYLQRFSAFPCLQAKAAFHT